MKSRVAWWCAGCVAVAGLVGCTTVSSPYSAPGPIPVSLVSSAYVASASANTVAMFTVAGNGLWTPTSPSTIATGARPESLAVSPDGRFVYTANGSSNTISQFVVNHADGTLQPNNPATVATGALPQWIALDPTGRFAYAVNTRDATLSLFKVDQQSGVLTPNTPSAIDASGGYTNSYAGGLVVDPLERFVFVNSGNAVLTYALNARTGLLTLTSQIAYPGGRGFAPAVDPAGRFLYAVSEDVGRLYVFAIDPVTGALAAAATPSVTTGDGPSSVAVDPSGTHLYVVNRTAANIGEYSLSADGTPVPLPTPLLNDGGEPWQILIDPSGQLAYVSNESTASVEIYRVSAFGQLSLYGSASAGVGAGGMGIARGH